MPDFLGQRLVLRRDAFHRVRNPAVVQHESIIGRTGFGPAGEAEPVQCPVQQQSGMIAGEGTPCRIGTMKARGESDDQQTGGRITEGSDGRAVIGGVLAAPFVEKGREPRAKPAVRIKHFRLEFRQGG